MPFTPGATLPMMTGALLSPPCSVIRLVRLPELSVSYFTDRLDRACSWLTLAASVGAEPAATLVTRRSAPDEPTETSPVATPAVVAPTTGV